MPGRADLPAGGRREGAGLRAEHSGARCGSVCPLCTRSWATGSRPICAAAADRVTQAAARHRGL